MADNHVAVGELGGRGRIRLHHIGLYQTQSHLASAYVEERPLETEQILGSTLAQ